MSTPLPRPATPPITSTGAWPLIVIAPLGAFTPIVRTGSESGAAVTWRVRVSMVALLISTRGVPPLTAGWPIETSPPLLSTDRLPATGPRNRMTAVPSLLLAVFARSTTLSGPPGVALIDSEMIDAAPLP
jgi:hypothetical protein